VFLNHDTYRLRILARVPPSQIGVRIRTSGHCGRAGNASLKSLAGCCKYRVILDDECPFIGRDQKIMQSIPKVVLFCSWGDAAMSEVIFISVLRN
jgi:hypothetical protein